MNRSSIGTSAVSNTQSANNERLAAIHESAKQRAQALRREAISGLIDGIVGRLFRKPTMTRCSMTTSRSQSACAA